MIERERIKPIGQGAELRHLIDKTTTPFIPSADSAKHPANLAPPPYTQRQSFPAYYRGAFQPLSPVRRG